MLKDVVKGMKNVVIDDFDGLVVKYVKAQGSRVMIRGLRMLTDFEYEFQMVGMNRAMDSSIETVFLMADARRQAIASKLVKEICRLGGDVSKFVTPAVDAALVRRLRRKA
jgi:pantetheine-phosphate adenylyltransferase